MYPEGKYSKKQTDSSETDNIEDSIHLEQFSASSLHFHSIHAMKAAF